MQITSISGKKWGLAFIALVTTSLLLMHNQSPQNQTNDAGFNPEWSATSWARKRAMDRANVPADWLQVIEQQLQPTGNAFHTESYGTYTLASKDGSLAYWVNKDGFNVAGEDWEVDFTSVEPDHFMGVQQVSDYELRFQFEHYDLQYLSTAAGLRQNIIYREKKDGPTVDYVQTITSDLDKQIVDNALVLSKGNKKVFTYTDLKVWDKEGTLLSGTMEWVEANQLALSVNVAQAAFPVTIDPVSTTYDWKIEGGSLTANLGFWIAGNGDLNGDGYSDVVVGAPDRTNTVTRQGAILIFYGGPEGLPLEPDKVIYGETVNASMGKCISIEGDVNGDGYDDLLVGSHQYSNPQNFEGKAYLFYGSAEGVSDEWGWSFEADRAQAKLGEALTMAGDLNGDGYDDVCIGAHGWDNVEEMGSAGNKAGKFWVFHGSADGLSEVPAMECVADITDANLGISIDKAGDVNGDGYDDLHVGGYIFLIGDGMICTFHGGPGGADNTPDFMAIGGAEDTSFYAVNLSNAGDVNGDGYNDVVIGVPRFDAGGIYQSGKLHLHYGGPAGIDTNIAWVVQGTQYDERFAFNVNDGHDLNNDGYDDVLVTSKYYLDPALMDSVGKTMVYFGSPNGPSLTPGWEFIGESTNGAGTNTCFAGDVNGDGQDDILISGNSYTNNFTSEGVVYGFYGKKFACDPPEDFQVISTSPTNASFTWKWLYGSTNYKLFLKELGSGSNPLSLDMTGNSVTVTGLKPGTSYQCYVKARCEDGYTERSEMVIIQTPPLRMDDTFAAEEPKLFPNPVKDVLHIDFGTSSGNAVLRAFDMSGNQVINRSFQLNGNRQADVTEMQDLQDGMYIISLEVNGTSRSFKITRAR